MKRFLLLFVLQSIIEEISAQQLHNVFCLLFLFASFNLILIILLNVLGIWQSNSTQ